LRVRASSLNYRDLMVLNGGGRSPTKLGVVLLSDGAGEVAAIGEGVSRAKIGDPVAGCFHPRWFGGPIKRNRKFADTPLERTGFELMVPDLSETFLYPSGAVNWPGSHSRF
jgi:NADPH:quinone reductase-like Zn-dependent oxidoreductase